VLLLLSLLLSGTAVFKMTWSSGTEGLAHVGPDQLRDAPHGRTQEPGLARQRWPGSRRPSSSPHAQANEAAACGSPIVGLQQVAPVPIAEGGTRRPGASLTAPLMPGRRGRIPLSPAGIARKCRGYLMARLGCFFLTSRRAWPGDLPGSADRCPARRGRAGRQPARCRHGRSGTDGCLARGGLRGI
jgi:hypothetical protein